MSTPQSSAHLTRRFRIGLGTVLATLGALVAIAVTIIMLTLTGANHAAVAIPVTASNAGVGSTPQIHYLGPRQEDAGLNRQTAQPPGRATTPTAGAGNPTAHYTCLGSVRRCLR